MSRVLTVNIGAARPDPATPGAVTGIVKEPVSAGVCVTAPGRDSGRSGFADDVIGSPKVHGGDDQAVYAYAREDLDHWESHLGRPLANGLFGENLTTEGVDVSGAVVGERWRVGDDGLLLEVASPRVPCRTFAALLGEPDWIKTFTAAGRPGAYLRVVAPGEVRGGDVLEVVSRPDHDVTVALTFRAMLREPELLARLTVADALAEDVKAKVRRRVQR